MDVAPARFSDKTEREEKLVSVTWPEAVLGSQTLSAAEWSSEPNGLNFTQQDIISGRTAQVLVSSGSRGVTYRVRLLVTLSGTGEKLEITSNGLPGIPMQITGHARSGDDYRWSHQFHAYGG